MHGHAHGNADGLAGSWSQWTTLPVLRVLLAGLVAAGVATVIGIAVLWPDGSGQDAAIDRAREVGLVSDRLGAVVEEITDGGCTYASPDAPQACRIIVVRPTSGPDAGTLVALPEYSLEEAGFAPELSIGQEIIVGFAPENRFYFYADHDRRSTLLVLVGLFAVVVVVLGRFRGLLALIAMAVTLAVLVGFVAPSVLDGNDPVVVALVAASAIAFVSLYLTHGVNPTTTVALAGTLMALGLTLALSWVFFEAARFTGLASEEGLTLPTVAGNVNLPSLLLGGAMIGALGALDDVTVTQVATVAELNHRDPTLRRRELIVSGIRVGREHIAATVNTLLLAYVGAGMPLLLLFVISDQSLAMIANSELIALEVVRTLCGSMGLIAAVPITTFLTAVLVGSEPGGHSADPDDADTVVDPESIVAIDADTDADPDSGESTGGDGFSGAAPRSAVVPPSATPPDPPPPPTPRPRWEDFGPRHDDVPEG